jgi:tripartite-type tricarboxylate transporter receptor subunit TctC
LCAPGDVPKDVLAKLSAETAKALASGPLPERLRAVGTTPQASTPEQLAEQIRRESANWAAIIKAKDIRVD